MIGHSWANRLQSLLLVLVLLAIVGLSGFLLIGREGIIVALGASLLALVLEPTASSWLTLRLYRARTIPPEAAPGLWRLLAELATRAGLPAIPRPYYVASPMVNAFAVGRREQAAIVLTDGLLNRLSSRELVGVIAHEIAHIAHGDLRVMSLADYISRLTGLFALAGQLFLLATLPWLLLDDLEINWWGLVMLIASPHLALLAQLGLSRLREYEADLAGARLTGDPLGLAAALARIERVQLSWRLLLMPGWGNPEPSWLRSHPDTRERIRRLQALALNQAMAVPDWLDSGWQAPPRRPAGRPRWRPGGNWW